MVDLPAATVPPLRRAERLAARLRRGAAGVEAAFDRVRWSIRRRFGWIDPIEIVTYRGWVGAERVHLSGRVFEHKDLGAPEDQPRLLHRALHMLRRLRSDEIPDVRLRVCFGDIDVALTTDAEGYFQLHALKTPALRVPGWQTATVETREAVVRRQGIVSTKAEMLVPSPAARRVIVSDIDDTVLETYVTRRLKMLWVTLTGDARTRHAFEGTAKLYRALVGGASQKEDNPIFYVSQSPWNLYDFLIAFLERNDLPRGPLLLRDMGLNAEAPSDSKANRVRDLMADYPDLPFVLLGDSGERDPELYLEVAAAHPGRVRAIYVRDLGGRERAGMLAELTRRARELGTELVFVTHARDALEHAVASGLAGRE